MKTASFCIMKLTAEQVKRRSGTVKRLGGKDIAEKTLEAYNEVFADIVNVLLFDGERMIRPEDLEEQTPRSIYKADGKLREIERDVAKKWIRNNIRIACIGLENQTETDRYMPLRVMGSDAADYRNQLRNLKKGKKPAAVVTLVLYFGYQGHWNAPTSLIEAMEVPEVLKPYVTDVKINLFEIAYLSRETVDKFESDFRVVADYFVQMRETGNYEASTQELDHIQAVLHLLNIMDQDHRFETALNAEQRERGEEAKTMSEWLTRVISENEEKGVKQGIEQGVKQGVEQGENRLGSLITKLKEVGRTDDAFRAAADPDYRKKLYKEFKLA